MFHFGIDYYPEQWPEERWATDAQLMLEAGFNVVRLGEFAWSKMEPTDGVYDFAWLDRAIACLQAPGIQVVLGTPTASPPPWLMNQHPELFRVGQDSRQATYGNRREYCPNHPDYHEHARRIVTRMAEHYSEHPAVIGWQIDNEFGDRCYCRACAGAFRKWLRGRYKSLDELNEKWGTVFWSHTYGDWDEIPVPVTTGGSPNPGLALDYFRFMSDSYVIFQQLQIDILREKCPEHFITHNFMGFKYDQLDYFDLARNLDLVSWDNYPRMQWNMAADVEPSRIALGHDTMRGLKRRNFWMMEQQAGPGGWEMLSVSPRPGELRLWAYQAIAHGADAVVFFRWRTARFGTEQYWHGLLDHDARPGRRYEEIKHMGAELKTAGDRIAGSEVRSRVAMALSYDSRFAFQIQPNNPRFSYPDHFHEIYRAFCQRGLSIDITSPDADLSSYQLLVAPALHLVTAAVAENLAKFVERGGALVVTQRTGVKDESNSVVNRRLPGLLAEVCGVEVEEYDSLALGMSNRLEFTLPELARARPPVVGVLCDILKPTGAMVVARYAQDYYAGKPAVTLNQFGRGRAVYIGAVGEAQLYAPLANWLLDMTGLQGALVTPAGVEITERWQGNERLLFVLNHSANEQEIELDRGYANLLAGPAMLERTVVIQPRDVLILVEAMNKKVLP